MNRLTGVEGKLAHGVRMLARTDPTRRTVQFYREVRKLLWRQHKIYPWLNRFTCGRRGTVRHV